MLLLLVVFVAVVLRWVQQGWKESQRIVPRSCVTGCACGKMVISVYIAHCQWWLVNFVASFWPAIIIPTCQSYSLINVVLRHWHLLMFKWHFERERKRGSLFFWVSSGSGGWGGVSTETFHWQVCVRNASLRFHYFLKFQLCYCGRGDRPPEWRGRRGGVVRLALPAVYLVSTTGEGAEVHKQLGKVWKTVENFPGPLKDG